MSEQSLLINASQQRMPRARRFVAARDNDQGDQSILMTACFASRKIEVCFDCVLFVASLVALFCADEQCRAFDPPVFYWLACAASLRLVDAMNLAWIVSMKNRIAPRKLGAMRIAAVIVRSSIMFISAVLLFLLQYWARFCVWDNGLRLIGETTVTTERGVCNSFLMETALYGNFFMFCFQLATFGISSLLLLCYCISYCCCCKSADERRVAMWLQRRQDDAARDPVGVAVVESAEQRVEGEEVATTTTITTPVGHRQRRWSDEAWRSLTTIVTFADLQEKREETECSICSFEFTPDCRVRTLPCRHFFHVECIDRWWKSETVAIGERSKEKSCPVCRAAITDAV